MSDQVSLAFTLANNLGVQLITLSAALIGFTVTFAKDFQLQHLVSRVLLAVIWLALFLSIIFGIFNIKALISVVAPLTPPLTPTTAPVAFSNESLAYASRQEQAFYVGLFLFIGLGCIAVFSKRPKTP
jgi:hypothetical protein